MVNGITSVIDSPTGCLAVESAVSSASTFPTDAVAVIYRPARSAMTSGTANSRKWKLRFERRSPPFIEPLMGWTGGDDPLAQVEMTFPSVEAAIAYARRQGLEFVLRESRMARCHRVSTLKPDDRIWRPPRFPPRALVKGPSKEKHDPAQAGAAPYRLEGIVVPAKLDTTIMPPMTEHRDIALASSVGNESEVK